MSSTRRKAEDDETLHQNRYASASPYGPPLLCNLVAKRAKALQSAEDRALVYFLQQLSHREGGMERVAGEVLAMFPERLGTDAMRSSGMKPGTVYRGKEAERVDRSLGRPRGSRRDDYLLTLRPGDTPTPEEEMEISVEDALAACRAAAKSLPDHLRRLCLDPSMGISRTDNGSNGGVWWFQDLIGALREYRQSYIASAERAIVETAISRRVFDDLDYAAHCRGLVIIEGDQRTGKSTAAKNWCDRHPGQAVYVKLGGGNDDATFFRSIARALGTAASLTRTPTAMQIKIEDALQEGHLVLVLDEAHFCFAQTQRPRSAPSRVDWLRTALVDFNVGVVLISTPQFDRACEMYERQLKWNAKQIKGRVKLQTMLPTELAVEDLTAVARFMAPNADAPSLLRLVGFAQSSDDYLAGIERLVSRAAFFAARESRTEPGRADIKRALDEAVPRLVTVESASLPPAPAPQNGVRATALKPLCKAGATTLSPARPRRISMDSPAARAAGFEASERLQFTDAAASE